MAKVGLAHIGSITKAPPPGRAPSRKWPRARPPRDASAFPARIFLSPRALPATARGSAACARTGGPADRVLLAHRLPPRTATVASLPPSALPISQPCLVRVRARARDGQHGEARSARRRRLGFSLVARILEDAKAGGTRARLPAPILDAPGPRAQICLSQREAGASCEGHPRPPAFALPRPCHTHRLALSPRDGWASAPGGFPFVQRLPTPPLRPRWREFSSASCASLQHDRRAWPLRAEAPSPCVAWASDLAAAVARTHDLPAKGFNQVWSHGAWTHLSGGLNGGVAWRRLLTGRSAFAWVIPERMHILASAAVGTVDRGVG
ncbi:hypothetical protein DAEQUDRAFT_763555 [Daedalea quercina L-15889]|uniref:Uncharacterized protein n=1 Tax=Daedalea quercina L-15889 TaxID=1314783 RepID=A0A165S9U8_9APHY|nr:hypothetical protein DAEQUDRAFT_763555 [Daedalea quercina L-15889]